MSNTIKRPGEFWWAVHPWASRVSFLQSNGLEIDTQSLQQKPARWVKMECKSHPVLILGPGDESLHGYLVCYLSSSSNSEELIPRQLLRGITVTEGKKSFVFRMAPCYCANEFIWKRIRTADCAVMDLVKGVLKRACRLAHNQKWDCFDFSDLQPDLPVESIEGIRTGLSEVFDALRHADEPRPETPPSKGPIGDPDTVLDSVQAL